MRLIDADALAKNLMTITVYNSNQYAMGIVKGVDRAVEMLQNAPTIDSENLRPQGEWIYHIDDLFPAEGTQECSNCHQEEKISLCNENYCPNCGAKMDGGE